MRAGIPYQYYSILHLKGLCQGVFENFFKISAFSKDFIKKDVYINRKL
jgi:hypothetical protein